MANEIDDKKNFRHLRITDPSPWITRFSPLIPDGGTVLDLACGGGRHSRYLLSRGLNVVAVDKNFDPVADLAGTPQAEVLQIDLEDGSPVFDPPGPLAGRTFDGVIVVNYLHRELFDDLIAAVAPGGVFLYETFARGNEVFTRPRNPDHLLRSGELLQQVQGRLDVVAYEHGIVETGPIPGVIQRLCAVKATGPSERKDGEPEPQKVPPA